MDNFALILNVLLAPYSLKYINTRFSSLKQEFVHEFIHYLDYKRIKEKSGVENVGSAKLLLSGGAKAYYNSPIEFNAFYQDGISSTETTLINLKNSGTKVGQDKFYEIIKNFNNFKNFAIKNFDRGFIKYLDVNNTRKLNKRLYNVFIDLKKTYVDEV